MTKPSERNSNSLPEPLEDPVFFVDRSLGGRSVVRILREAGWKVERHDDHFPADTPDTTWILEVGRRGWFILTADDRLRYNPTEKGALLSSGTLTFILASRKNLTGPEMGGAFRAVRASILAVIESQPPPAIFKVYAAPSHVARWHPK